WEKELAGTYLSDHPIQRYMKDIKAANTTLLGEIDETMHKQPIMVAGMINSIRPHQTKKGKPMAFVEIEDVQTIREVVLFPRTYEAYKPLLKPGNLIVVKGKVDAADGRSPKILADTVTNELTTYRAADESTSMITPPPPEPPTLFEEPPRIAETVASSYRPADSDHPNGSNGHNGHGSNGSNGSNGSSRPEEPVVVPPEPPAELPPSNPVASSHRLHITLPRTGNLAKDKHRLKTIYSLLTEKSGSDDFIIYIPNGNQKIQIAFPNQSTRYTAHLEQQLVQILGAKSVRVE
ncbi:MAG: hypothetical protein KDI79_19710, partial [Anaerolineae bacterium]|nr:hypothetical protein [Anaerolineae bacterium]